MIGNTVTDCLFGIGVFSGTHGTISGNTATYCISAGITIGNLASSTVTSNVARHNWFGIFLQEGAVGAIVSRNQCYDSDRVGINVQGNATGNVIELNTVSRSLTADLGDGNPECVNGWRDNAFVTDNETGVAAGRLFGCIR